MLIIRKYYVSMSSSQTALFVKYKILFRLLCKSDDRLWWELALCCHVAVWIDCLNIYVQRFEWFQDLFMNEIIHNESDYTDGCLFIISLIHYSQEVTGLAIHGYLNITLRLVYEQPVRWQLSEVGQSKDFM